MGQKAVSEVVNGLLDGTAQAIADARPGIEGVLVVALQPAGGGGIDGLRQARGVQQAVEDGEIGK